MKIMPKLNEKIYGVFASILFAGSPLLMSGCKESSFVSCAAPTAVDCGEWVQLGSGTGSGAFLPLLMENTAQVTLPITDNIQCANNSGTIIVPSTSNGFTIEISSPLVCSMTNTGSCICTGSAYLPPPDPYGTPPAPYPIVIGQYNVNLTCTDKNSGSVKTFSSSGGC